MNVLNSDSHSVNVIDGFLKYREDFAVTKDQRTFFLFSIMSVSYFMKAKTEGHYQKSL